MLMKVETGTQEMLAVVLQSIIAMIPKVIDLHKRVLAIEESLTHVGKN